MIDFNYQPETYFEGTGSTALLAKMTYPETQWGEEVSLYVNAIDGGEFYYEAVDFYGNDFNLNPDHSSEPLTLQEIIIQIETIEVEVNGVGNASSTLRGTPEVESYFYPDLKSYFLEKRSIEKDPQ